MVPAYFSDAKFWRLLKEFDEDLGAQACRSGCPLCSAPLHSARYPRKPRGVSRAVLGESETYRVSFCCAREGCRRRTTPPSVRFLGRRVYLGALVVLVSALSQGLTASRRARLRGQFRLSERTLRRWQRWWREVFPTTRGWQAVRGQFAVAVDVTRLPASLLERFTAAQPDARLLDVLRFVAALSNGAEQAR
jgi:hypothetical protein